ncbi:hydroxycarboxylic acid receptor 2-like [Syngnathus typhle]|uniref:hydroxycarboxylic acid receptor 2-like n=1 Tax=Syngnathus typhle TaxID=161592 RepID=UPI002A6B2442|nr:hydroxycarboxylic acid receptor 2-like [Syngnathus typhle]
MSRSDGEARSTPAPGTPAPGTPAPGGVCPPVGIQLEGIILPPVLTLDVVLGLLGNAVALWVFCFRLKRWNANTVFLVNLVAADFLALVSLPLRIHALLAGRWVFGDVACRLNLFLMFSNRTASIALMTVIAFYRYAKVVHPLGRLTRLNKRQAGVLALLVWLLVSAPRLPMLAYDHIKRGRGAPQCFFFTSYQEASRGIVILVAMHRALTVLEFVVALALLLFCWVRIRRSLMSHRQMGDGGKVRKALRVCAAIVAIFLLCFLPTSVTTLGLWLSRSLRPHDCAAFYALTQLTIVSLGLNFLNSALDPILYVFSSSVFRKALLAAVPPRLRRCRAWDADSSESGGASRSTGQVELGTVRPTPAAEAL